MERTCTEEENTLLISHRKKNQEDEEDKEEELDSGFQFKTGSSFQTGLDSSEPVSKMSTADELFFKGKILPLRARLPGSGRIISRSKSVELQLTGIKPDRKIINNFIDHSQPSPLPQIRRSSSMMARVNTNRNTKSVSSFWDFLRLGLVRTPEMAKLSVSRNSSCSSTSSNSKKSGSEESRTRRRRVSFSFAVCKRLVERETVVPVKVNVMGEKKKREKTAMARKRTFDWLKELSHGGRTTLAS